jgi:ParB family chromosome partitioning protein
MARKPLGRGLSALLGDAPAEAPQATGSVSDIDLSLIDPNPEQPRTRFADEALDELAQSIKTNGIVQPIVVRERGGRYQIVAGERRWRAAQRAGMHKVPVNVREVSDDKLLEVALIENIQRQELNPVEEAKAYRKLIDNIGLTQEQVAEQVGKERSLVATALRLLKLPDDILKMIEEGKLSAGHGRALLLSDDIASQRRAARTAIEKGMSVRETEKFVKRANDLPTKGTKRVTVTKDANVRSAETKLMRALGTNVRIKPNGSGNGGAIEIEYYNTSDLDRVYQLIMRNKEAS